MDKVTNGFARGNYPEPHPESVALFWSKVDRENGPIHPTLGTRCHPWRGQIRKDDGYGKTAYRVGGARVFLPAHRFAWLVTVGDPGTLHVLHRCDNRLCCNVEDHLFDGTNQANVDDMIQKDRKALGMDAGGQMYSKFLRVVIHEIRAAHGNAAAILELAARYDVHPQYIRAIARRKPGTFDWIE